MTLRRLSVCLSVPKKLKHRRFIKRYDQYSLETWHQRYFMERPFRPHHFEWPSSQVAETVADKKSWKNSNIAISRVLWPLRSWNLAQRYFVTRPFRPCQSERPSPKVTVKRADGKSSKSSGIFLITITNTVMKACTMTVDGKAFHGMPVQVTYIQGHMNW